MASTAGSDTLFSVQLTRVTDAAREARLFTFAPLAGALPPVQPGAHIDLHLPGALQRQYSLVTSLCSANQYVIAVKREAAGRGGSLWLHDQARVGTALQVGQPRNNFPLDETAEATLLLAGGIGITPIYAMFARLQELGRPVQLHYWSRSPEHSLFRDHLQDHPNVALHYSSVSRRAGVAEVLRSAKPRTAIYCCGPGRMLDECASNILDGSRLQVERFTNIAAVQGADQQDGFTVHLARTGRDVTVAVGETILNALIAAGIDVSYSCEEGVCGACETRLLAGTALHRDMVRSAEDHVRLGTIMICCSRGQDKRLVLDL